MFLCLKLSPSPPPSPPSPPSVVVSHSVSRLKERQHAALLYARSPSEGQSTACPVLSHSLNEDCLFMIYQLFTDLHYPAEDGADRAN